MQDVCVVRSGNVSGWYARLDRECPSREEQIDTWLNSWEISLARNLPVAAVLPEQWPTLPASLLTDPGHVLDQLLARFDAECDGRSPRGANPTPTLLVDAILADELRIDYLSATTRQPATPKLTLAALPPGFHIHAEQLNGSMSVDDEEEFDEESLEEILSKRRTKTGIHLPFADPAVGGGLFPARLLRWHSDAGAKMNDEDFKEDSRTLLSRLQLLDISEEAREATWKRLYLESVRFEIASLDDTENNRLLSRSEAEKLLQTACKIGDTLRGEWPWDENPRLLMTNPPWLRIKDRFRGYENGSELRKQLGKDLRNLTEEDGSLRFSTLKGNVNLYRLFLERSLQLVQSGGRIRLTVPDSLLREQSSAPLRSLMVNSHEWTSTWTFPDSSHIFTGASQGVLTLGLTVGGETDEMLIYGPIERGELCTKGGLSAEVPNFSLERSRWNSWSGGDYAVPRLPRQREERSSLLKIIDELSNVPRLTDPNHWLSSPNEQVKVRVGEVDQTNWNCDIHSWKKGSRGVPFIRGIHFRNFGDEVWLHHPSIDSQIGACAPERKQALWRGDISPTNEPRLACQAIVNAQQTKRMRWVVIPKGCVIGNSVNHLEIPTEILRGLARTHRSKQKALEWLSELLNSEELDSWSRAWAANNNVNNYELELLPLMNEQLKSLNRLS